MDTPDPAGSVFHGQGVQNSGSGFVHVGRDVIINSSSDRDQNTRCLEDLRITDPRHDKARILSNKDDLLADSYIWIRDNADFKRWHDEEESRVLWIRGDPGKGKTMLLCGIIDDLTESKSGAKKSKTSVKKLKTSTGAKNLSFFFCQATDARINNATAVIRGLIYMLLEEQPTLISHVRQKYDSAGGKLFQDVNAWFALSDIFTNIIQDPDMNSTYFIIDALDECTTDLPRLLDFIVTKSSESSRAKWIISSRNWPSIQKDLEGATEKIGLCLELNEQSISAAVEKYIKVKVDFLAGRNRYRNDVRDDVQRYLLSNANATFLWVSLVCEQLCNISGRIIRNKLKNFPPKLDELYRRMMDQVCDSDEAEVCKNILAVVSVAYRPITLKELLSLVDIDGVGPDDDDLLTEIIGYCGSFLTLRESTISFVHQSAKDYLVKDARVKIFPDGCIEKQQRTMVLQSIEAMQKVLRRDVYNLRDPGRFIDEIKSPNPNPLDPIRYAFTYWLDHLSEVDSSGDGEILRDGSKVDGFIRKHFLHWLEAMSLVRGVSDAAFKLAGLLKKFSFESQLYRLAYDAYRFILSHQPTIKNYPLQTYSSALVFSPVNSLTRILFQNEELDWIITKPAMDLSWGACLQTLRGDNGFREVAFSTFSNDGTQIAIVLEAMHGTVEIWDTISGGCIRILDYRGFFKSAVFLNNDLRIAVMLDTGVIWTVQIWDATSDTCLQQVVPGETPNNLQTPLDYGNAFFKLKGPRFFNLTDQVILSNDGTQIAIEVGFRGIVEIWETVSGACIQILHYYGHQLWSIAFSPDNILIASGSFDRIRITIWQTTRGACRATLQGHHDEVNSISFSNDNTRTASDDDDEVRRIDFWYDSRANIESVIFSNDGRWIASKWSDGTIKIWDTNGTCVQTLFNDNNSVTSIAFSNDNTRIASGLFDGTIKIWDFNGACLQTIPCDSGPIRLIAFSHDGTRIVSGSYGGRIKIWDISGACLLTPHDRVTLVRSIVFSNDGTRIASESYNSYGRIKIWDISGTCIQKIHSRVGLASGPIDLFPAMAFSNDNTRIAVGSKNEIKIWDTGGTSGTETSGTCMQIPSRHTNWATAIAFSNDDTKIASGSLEGIIEIWDISGACIQSIHGHTDQVNSIAFSNDSRWIVSGACNNTIKIWDTNGVCLNTTSYIGNNLGKLMFDITGSQLLCERGAISLKIPSGSNTELVVTTSEPRYYNYGYGVCNDREWITWNGQNILRLPEEYRPLCVAVTPSAIAISCELNRILIFTFSSKGPIK